MLESASGGGGGSAWSHGGCLPGLGGGDLPGLGGCLPGWGVCLVGGGCLPGLGRGGGGIPACTEADPPCEQNE